MRLKTRLFAALLFLAAYPPAAARSAKTKRELRLEADAIYQAGIDRYAAGRYPEALAAFEEALRRNPGSHAARVAANRVRAEMAMAGAPRPGSEPPAGGRGAAPPEAETVLDQAVRICEFEDTIGDEREALGRSQAMQGRIAQLLAERRVARARGRRFAKDCELRALSRRLP